MGLDSVDLLVRVEKAFDITISDCEAEEIETVGDFHEAVWRHIQHKNSDKCKSQMLFYKLRQAFVDSFDFPKQHFRLETSLNKIFPKENRRQLYFDFEKGNNLLLPELTLPKFWNSFLSYFAVIMIFGGFALSLVPILFFNYTKWTLLIPVVGIAITSVISKSLNPKRTIIKPDLVRDFVQNVIAKNYEEISDKNQENRKDMESVINHIIADSAGLELSEITPEKKICHDLGID